MDESGYVPLVVISRFNRVRALTQDIATIKESLQGSLVLEIKNERVRKKGNWKRWLMGKGNKQCTRVVIIYDSAMCFFVEWFNCVCGWLVEFANLLHVCNF